LEATEVIGHNIKFDALWLARKCNVHLVKMVDTSSASRILSNGDSKLGNRLAEVADRYLGIELRKDQGRSDWGALMLRAEQIQYAAQNVEHLHALKEKLDAELKAAALMGVLRLKMDLLPVVVGMELIGFCVDRKKLEELAADATQERDQVAQTVNNFLETRDVNLNALARPRDCSQEYERGIFIGMPASGCRRYLGAQEMEEAERGCRVSHPRNPARRPNSWPV
jgi:ribonuclease D